MRTRSCNSWRARMRGLKARDVGNKANEAHQRNWLLGLTDLRGCIYHMYSDGTVECIFWGVEVSRCCRALRSQNLPELNICRFHEVFSAQLFS